MAVQSALIWKDVNWQVRSWRDGGREGRRGGRAGGREGGRIEKREKEARRKRERNADKIVGVIPLFASCEQKLERKVCGGDHERVVVCEKRPAASSSPGSSRAAAASCD